jgi:hypothetical protein
LRLSVFAPERQSYDFQPVNSKLLIGNQPMSERLGFILLSIWLILEGLILLLGLTFEGLNIIMGLLALAAGVIILLRDFGVGRRRRR